MRELYCRGKDVKTNKWIYGGYVRHVSTQPSPTEKNPEKYLEYLIIKDGFADWNMPIPIECFKVIPETIGQYTGLKDKNGVKIFEGDIIKGVYKYLLIEYENGVFGYRDTFGQIVPFGTLSVWGFGTDKCTCEVIGNIHDTPELLR